jgi:hypothetical protein
MSSFSPNGKVTATITPTVQQGIRNKQVNLSIQPRELVLDFIARVGENMQAENASEQTEQTTIGHRTKKRKSRSDSWRISTSLVEE